MVQSWSNYWSASGDSWHYSMLRILWTPFHLHFALVHGYFSLTESHLPALPYPWLGVLSEIPYSLVTVLCVVHVVCVLLVLVGWQTRLLQVVIACLSVPIFFHSVSQYQNHYGFYLFVTLCLAFASTDRYYSLDAKKQRSCMSASEFSAWKTSAVSLLPQRLILLQLSFLYVFSALNKLRPIWMQRWALSQEFLYLTPYPMMQQLWSTAIDLQVAVPAILALVLFMIGLGLCLPLLPRYPGLAVAGIVLHAVFQFTLPVIVFSSMCSVILLFACLPSSDEVVQANAQSVKRWMAKFDTK